MTGFLAQEDRISVSIGSVLPLHVGGAAQFIRCRAGRAGTFDISNQSQSRICQCQQFGRGIHWSDELSGDGGQCQFRVPQGIDPQIKKSLRQSGNQSADKALSMAVFDLPRTEQVFAGLFAPE